MGIPLSIALVAIVRRNLCGWMRERPKLRPNSRRRISVPLISAGYEVNPALQTMQDCCRYGCPNRLADGFLLWNRSTPGVLCRRFHIRCTLVAANSHQGIGIDQLAHTDTSGIEQVDHGNIPDLHTVSRISSMVSSEITSFTTVLALILWMRRIGLFKM